MVSGRQTQIHSFVYEKQRGGDASPPTVLSALTLELWVVPLAGEMKVPPLPPERPTKGTLFSLEHC